MSRRDYRAIAEILRDVRMSSERRAELVSRLVTTLADENPRFSPSRFREAATPDEDRIETRGRANGKAAGSWVIDGRTTTETAAAILGGIEEGDPAVIDGLPVLPRVNGEWADDPTWSTILEQEGLAKDPTTIDRSCSTSTALPTPRAPLTRSQPALAPPSFR
jgi:hypothetical protein